MRSLSGPFNRDDRDRFWGRVKVGSNDECWPWQANTENGRGVFFLHGLNYSARRVAYAMHYGKLGPSEVDLTCQTTSCCNPSHMLDVLRTIDIGPPILIRCYACGTKTLLFNERNRTWSCRRCNRELNMDQAMNEIARYGIWMR